MTFGDMQRCRTKACAHGDEAATDCMQCLTSDLTPTHQQLNERGLLTPRQQEVIVGVPNGMTTKQIAASLGISAKTADCHRVRLMHKLNLHSTAAVVRYAVRFGLVQP